MSVKSATMKVISLAVGGGLALTGAAAIQAPVAARAGGATSTTTATTIPATCRQATTTYAKAIQNATKAQKTAAKAVTKAKKARKVNSHNKKTSKKYTATKSHRKLIANVKAALKNSRATSLRTATRCGSSAEASRITKVANRANTNTKRLAAATSKLSRNVALFAPVKGTSIRMGKVKTTVLKNGFVYKSWPAKVWSCAHFYSSRFGGQLNCRWVKITENNDRAVHVCFSTKSGGTVTFRSSKGWTSETAKRAAPKYCDG